MTVFGRDLSCTDQLFTSRLVTGKELLAQACFRRLTNQQGTLRGSDEDRVYGLDIPSLIGVYGDSAIASIPDRIRNQLLLDERLQDARVTVTQPQRGTFWIQVGVTASDDTSFSFVLSVDGVSTQFLGFENA